MANTFAGLVDQYNRPIKKPDLVQEQASPTVGGVRKVWSDSVAAGMTPQKMGRMLKTSRGGDNAEFLRFAEEMEERDPHYAAVLNTRKLAVVSLAAQIEAASDDAKDVEMADAVRSLIKTAGFRRMKYDALDGLGKGYSVVEIDWQATATSWKPLEYLWRDQSHFQWGVDGRELRLRKEGSKEGVELTPGRFMVHVPQLKSGLPARNGLARLGAWNFILKSYSLKDWAQFAETFGLPMRIGKYDRDATPKDKAALLRALRMMAHDFAAVIPEGMDVELIQAASGRGGEAVFGGLAKYIDKAFSKAVLGQTMTTDNGSSQAQANVHNEVRMDIVAADAEQLAETIQTCIIIPFINFNYGMQEHYPQFTLPAEAAEDLEKLANVIGTLTGAGLTLQASEVRDRFGFADPEKGAELIGGFTATDTTGETAQNRAHVSGCQCGGCRKARNRVGDERDESEFDRIGADALANWQEQLDPLLDPIRKAANSVSTYEEFLERLPDAASEGDINRLATALGKAMFLSMAQGDGGD
ncbi:MAG: DUF935 domain-containing protein [Pseudomonadota bacterium]